MYALWNNIRGQDVLAVFWRLDGILLAMRFFNLHCTSPADMTFTVTSAIAAPLSGDKHDYQSMGYYWWPCNEAIKVCNKACA
jgi:hypothetical protein